MTGYELTRTWFDWSFENPDLNTPTHTATYMWIIEKWNRSGHVKKIVLPSSESMAAIGVKSYNTYIKVLNDLIEFGFIEMIQKSKNQFTANIIAISNFNKALDKALDKAMIKHSTKQDESTGESIDSIYKQDNKETNKQDNKVIKEISNEILPSVLENEKLRLEIEELKKQLLDTEKKERKISVKKKERFEPPTVEEVESYFIENGFRKESGTKAYNYYSVADWQDSQGSKVKNWKQKMQAVWFKDENKQNTSYARNTSTNPTTIVIDENGNTKQSNSEFRPFGLDNNRQEGKPLLRFVNPANVPSFGYVRPTDEVITGE